MRVKQGMEYKFKIEKTAICVQEKYSPSHRTIQMLTVE